MLTNTWNSCHMSGQQTSKRSLGWITGGRIEMNTDGEGRMEIFKTLKWKYLKCAELHQQMLHIVHSPFTNGWYQRQIVPLMQRSIYINSMFYWSMWYREWGEFPFPGIPVRISLICSRSTMRNDFLFLVLVSTHEKSFSISRSRLDTWDW